MADPYRTEDRDAEVERPPAELLYRSDDHERHAAPARGALQLGLIGSVVGLGVAMAGYGVPAAVVLVGFAGAAIWTWRRTPEVSGVLLAVKSGDIRVSIGKRLLTNARLNSLLDVRLDTKSIQMVVPGDNAVPGVRFINSKVSPEVDVARILLVFDHKAEPIRLTETFMAHMDAVNWVGKIRSFLRKQGWVPDDEREEIEDDEED